MVCPECGTEMETGNMISVTNRSGTLVWLPEQYLTQHALCRHRSGKFRRPVVSSSLRKTLVRMLAGHAA